jgi:hypothetical protein
MIRIILYGLVTLTSVSCIRQKSASNLNNDPLFGTSWRFVGYVSQASDSIYRYPDDYNFTIQFDSRSKISGKAFDHYSGTYKYRKDGLLINANISVSYNSHLDTVTYGASGALHHIRLYEHSLSMSDPVRFEISNSELLIYSRRVMKFVKIP